MIRNLLCQSVTIDINKLVDKRFENDLKFLRKNSLHEVVMGQRNITLLQNKFDFLIIVPA